MCAVLCVVACVPLWVLRCVCCVCVCACVSVWVCVPPVCVCACERVRGGARGRAGRERP